MSAAPVTPAAGGRCPRLTGPRPVTPPARASSAAQGKPQLPAPAASRPALVPLAGGEAAEGDQSDDGEDDPEPEAPHDRDDRAHDHEDPPDADPAGHRSAASSVDCHCCLRSV